MIDSSGETGRERERERERQRKRSNYIKSKLDSLIVFY